MVDPNYELRYVVKISDPFGCAKDDHHFEFYSLDEAREYCRRQSDASKGMLLFRLFDSFDGVELDY